MKKKTNKQTRCIVYLHANNCMSSKASKVETTQSRFLVQYAKSHNIKIVSEMRGNGMGQQTINIHFDQMVNQIVNGYAEGILVVNMHCLAKDYCQALNKINKVILAGGYIYSAEDGGKLGTKIKSFEVKCNERN